MKVMTYNIKYANEDDGENSWSFRKEALTGLLKFFEPDIIGLQEALQEQLAYFQDNLKRYEYVGVARKDGKTEGEFSPVLYRSDKFEVLHSDTFWLSETPEKPSKGWDAAYPRICTYAIFKHKETGKKFCFFNTHFDHRGDEARKKSARLIYKKTEELNKENLPVILTGDLNLEPQAEGVQYLAEKFLDSREACKTESFGPEKTFNAYHLDDAPISRIDYIFISREGVEIEKYGVLNNSYDQKYPSDHFPVMVELQLK
ncbi:endonuclease/exonuclease/phosphatase family protein [Zunongwangia sp. F363]|uniref:Endonuclease/exonuclease/phosphatase family protein n=1 Tax=Autumnicola tepida TaxID=3075595 RepID=A0ABU3CA39_9FLAO|nr:endonuclease/exonuclease/phosphatase family protein [Zunongwangia sp. F363]MDT0643207.1 endonuclease/exonuclease/phosphatase family protein [Zunongwangia sp. F363]